MLLRGRMSSRIKQVDPHVPHLAESDLFPHPPVSTEGLRISQLGILVSQLLYEEIFWLISTPVQAGRWLEVSRDFCILD